jgi:hypothetical protein
MQTKCNEQDSSTWTMARSFQTTGCCTPPDKFNYEVKLTNNSAQINWVNIDAAMGYTVRYRSTDADWTILHTDINAVGIENLKTCTTYEVQILTHCELSKTDFSSSFFIKTTGCGACMEQSYCNSKATHAEDEWIETFSIGEFLNKSPKSNGYQAFTDQSIYLKSNKIVPISITPGFTGQPYKEFFRIFLDLNADGDFNDPGELVFDPGFALEGAINGFITIPNINQRIVTRMRVSMKFAGSSFSKSPEPCEIINFGEVEDYCVTISPENSSTQYPGHERALRIYPQPATTNLNIELPETAQALQVYNSLGQLIHTEDLNGQTKANVLIENWKSGIYFVKVTDANGRTEVRKVVKE